MEQPFCISQISKRLCTILICILFIPYIILSFLYTNNSNYIYPVLIGNYCFPQSSSADHIPNYYINDSPYIQQCSFTNIDACQHIHNQTFLFRLHSFPGLTSELNNLVRAFIFAIHTRRKFLIDDQHWNYGSFSSFFNISQAHFSPWLPASSYCSQRQFLHLHNYQQNDTHHIPSHITTSRGPDGGFTQLSLLMEPLENDNKTMVIRRLVVDYLWKTLNNETRHFIDQHLNEIQIETITYGMHIRRGDKATEAKAHSTPDYIAGIESFMARQQRHTNSSIRIYVASDESNVINELEKLKPEWEFVKISGRRKQSDGHNQVSFNRLPENVRVELGRIMLTELEILSHVKYVVCTFSSNICRFLQVLRKQDVDTVLSLDDKWYPR